VRSDEGRAGFSNLSIRSRFTKRGESADLSFESARRNIARAVRGMGTHPEAERTEADAEICIARSCAGWARA